MLFYFDEAGDFHLPGPDCHKVSVYAGLVIPETSRAQLEAVFGSWSQALTPREKKNGEPKGALLRPETRALFFDHLDKVPDILTVPTILDLQQQRAFNIPRLRDLARDEGLRRSPLFEDEDVRRMVGTLARQTGNLDDCQLLRLHTLIHCVESALRQAIRYKSAGVLAACWDRIVIRIDQVATRPGTREEQIFRAGLPVAIMKRSERNPIAMIEQIHTPEHPLVKNFESDGGLRAAKMLSDLRFVNSRDDSGIRAADVLANSLMRAVNDLDNVRGELKWYARFMKHRPLGLKSDLGLMMAIPGGGPPRPAHKYNILSRIMASKKSP